MRLRASHHTYKYRDRNRYGSMGGDGDGAPVSMRAAVSKRKMLACFTHVTILAQMRYICSLHRGPPEHNMLSVVAYET